MGHIDDSLLVGYSYSACYKNIEDTVSLFTQLGFTIHPDKPVLVPKQIIEFLGFVIDSRAMTVKLLPAKAAKVKAACQNLLTKNSATIREVAQVIGFLVSSFPAMQFAQLHYRNLEHAKISALRENKGNYESTMTIPELSKIELTWWVKSIETAF
jgi:hypothetical protein